MGGLLLASCDDDSTNEIASHGLDVVSAQTSFPAAGGTQTIAVAQTPVSYYVNDSWATVSVSGNNVNVTAAENPDRQSRHATVVVKSSEQDSAVVDIDQYGMVLTVLNDADSLVTFNQDDAESAKIALRHDLGVDVWTSDASWLSAQMDGDSLVVNAQQNDTGLPRFGWVYFSSGNASDSLRVLQFELEKDVLGDYYMYYYSRGWYYLNVNFAKTSSGYAMTFTDSFMSSYYGVGAIPIDVYTDYPGFYFTNDWTSIGQNTYRSVNYQLAWMVMFTDDSYIYRTRDAIMANCLLQEEDGYQYYEPELLAPSGMESDYAGYSFYAFRIGRTTDGTYSGYSSALLTFPYAQFEKVTDEDESGAKAMHPVAAHNDRVPARLKWKAPQLLPEADLTL